MQSLVRKKSYGSVTVFWFDRDKAIRLIREKAEALGKQCPEVRKVGLFGSLAAGRAVPGSDADIIIILSQSSKRTIDRSDDYINYFDNIGVGVDLFCWTEKEAENSSMAQCACADAVWFFEHDRKD